MSLVVSVCSGCAPGGPCDPAGKVSPTSWPFCKAVVANGGGGLAEVVVALPGLRESPDSQKLAGSLRAPFFQPKEGFACPGLQLPSSIIRLNVPLHDSPPDDRLRLCVEASPWLCQHGT